MTERRPMLYARVEQETFEDVQALADKHYDGNLSVLVRLAVKRFTAFLKKTEAVAEDESVEGPVAA